MTGIALSQTNVTCVAAVASMLRYNDAVIRSILRRRRKKKKKKDTAIFLTRIVPFISTPFNPSSFICWRRKVQFPFPRTFPLPTTFIRWRGHAEQPLDLHILRLQTFELQIHVVESRVQRQAKLRRNALLLLLALSWLVQRREVLIRTVDVFRYVTLNWHNLARQTR